MNFPYAEWFDQWKNLLLTILLEGARPMPWPSSSMRRVSVFTVWWLATACIWFWITGKWAWKQLSPRLSRVNCRSILAACAWIFTSAFRLFYFFLRSSTASLSCASVANVLFKYVAYICDIRDSAENFFPYMVSVTKGFLSFIAHKCQISHDQNSTRPHVTFHI